MNSDFDKFYVYRSLHQDESWGALILDSSTLNNLPNLSFGMKIYARNEKEAIIKAKLVYDKIHAYDGDKKILSEFMAVALGPLVWFQGDKNYPDIVAEKSLNYAKVALKQYNEHFNELEKENNE